MLKGSVVGLKMAVARSRHAARRALAVKTASARAPGRRVAREALAARNKL